MMNVFKNRFTNVGEIRVGDQVKVHSYIGEPWEDYYGVVKRIKREETNMGVVRETAVVKESNGSYMRWNIIRLEKV